MASQTQYRLCSHFVFRKVNPTKTTTNPAKIQMQCMQCSAWSPPQKSFLPLRHPITTPTLVIFATKKQNFDFPETIKKEKVSQI